jgi:4-amino-4-deoxychorismate lyase
VRLQRDCKRLAIPFCDFSNLRSVLNAVAAEHRNGRHVVKVLISRGEGGRGYSPVGCEPPNFHLSIHSYPSHYEDWPNNGISLGLASLRLAKQPLLAGIKHLNRLEQVLIKCELIEQNLDDLLVLDTDDRVIECSAANVFWYSKQSGWYTPKIEYSGVAGVMREAIIAFMKTHKVSLQLGHHCIDSFIAADAVIVCNSLMGIIPVTCIQIESQTVRFKPKAVSRFSTDFNSWLLTQ